MASKSITHTIYNYQNHHTKTRAQYILVKYEAELDEMEWGRGDSNMFIVTYFQCNSTYRLSRSFFFLLRVTRASFFFLLRVTRAKM